MIFCPRNCSATSFSLSRIEFLISSWLQLKNVSRPCFISSLLSFATCSCQNQNLESTHRNSSRNAAQAVVSLSSVKKRRNQYFAQPSLSRRSSAVLSSSAGQASDSLCANRRTTSSDCRSSKNPDRTIALALSTATLESIRSPTYECSQSPPAPRCASSAILINS